MTNLDTIFDDCKNADELQAAYRKAAKENHPDRGGNESAMKTINNAFEARLKIVGRMTAAQAATAASVFRSEFYTASGWKGANYRKGLQTKEIAQIVRGFLKEKFNDFRFSVRSDYNSIDITLKESPVEIFKDPAEWTDADDDRWFYKLGGANELRWHDRESDQIKRSQHRRIWTEFVREMVLTVNAFVKSYRWDDSDSMIDYFNTNFYFHGVEVPSDEDKTKVVPRVRKAGKTMQTVCTGETNA